MQVVKRSVAIDPVLDRVIRGTWEGLVDAGYDVSYSTVLNFLLTLAVLQTAKHGIDEDIAQTLKELLETSPTVLELDIVDAELKLKDIAVKALLQSTEEEAEEQSTENQ